MNKLKSFVVGGKELPVIYITTNQVKEGVECDVYSFDNDDTKDLAVIRVQKGFSTPLQKVIGGEQTVEGYIAGEGSLMVKPTDGQVVNYEFAAGKPNDPIVVNIGELIQWTAAGDSELTFYELCTPPYEDGRFEEL